VISSCSSAFTGESNELRPGGVMSLPAARSM
jgi:hypothetical protein